jgi:predicted nucleic acid-binding protein
VKYLVDSDWIADYLKGRPEAVELLNRLAPEGLAISILSLGEIQEGILFGDNRARHEAGFRDFLRGVDVLPLTKTAMRHFAAVRGELRQSGELIGDMDLLIAATALAYKLTLVTRNERHFRRIPGLALYR